MVAAIGLRRDNRWALGRTAAEAAIWRFVVHGVFTPYQCNRKFVQAGVDVPTVLSMTVITLVAFLLLLTVVVRFYLALLPSFLVIW